MGPPMTRLFVLALLLSVGAASADTNPPSPAETNSPAPTVAPERPMVRNIGFAEQGDAIIVRNRKVEPEPKTEPKAEPATKPEQK